MYCNDDGRVLMVNSIHLRTLINNFLIYTNFRTHSALRPPPPPPTLPLVLAVPLFPSRLYSREYQNQYQGHQYSCRGTVFAPANQVLVWKKEFEAFQDWDSILFITPSSLLFFNTKKYVFEEINAILNVKLNISVAKLKGIIYGWIE